MNEPILDKGTELQGLSTAVLFPSVELFGGRVRKAVGPLTPIVGVSLFQRTVLTLQRAGIRQLIVLSGPEEEQLKQALLRGPRVTIPVRWMPIREFPLDDPRTWESLAAEVRGFCLLSGVGTVFPRPLIEQLRSDVRAGQAIVVGPAMPDGGDAVARAWRSGQGGGMADFMVMPASELSAAGRLAAEFDTMPIARWLERAAVDGRVRLLAGADDPSLWYQPVLTEGDLLQAERRLYTSLKGEFEGFVDRFFNRKLSRWCTRAFVAIGWSPNAKIAEDVVVDDQVVIKQGTPVKGVVVESAAKRRMGRAGNLSYTLTETRTVDRQVVRLRAGQQKKGDSHVTGVAVTTTAVGVFVPVAAPFFLLRKG